MIWAFPRSELPLAGLFTAGYERSIQALLGHELAVCASLNNLSAVQHQDLVGVTDRLQPVSDHQNGLVPSQGFNGLLQPVLILRVYIGGGLVQDYDGSVFQDSPSNGDALLLAAGKTGTTLADDGVIALGQGENEVVATGFLRRSHHFLVGGTRASKLDVVFHRVGLCVCCINKPPWLVIANLWFHEKAAGKAAFCTTGSFQDEKSFQILPCDSG